MAKLDFPNNISVYRGFISGLQTYLQDIQRFAKRRPGVSGEIVRHFTPLMEDFNTKVVRSGVKFNGPAVTGTYVNGYTFTMSNGVITAIEAS
jgi:hypothetical protein